jgi:NADH-quinone oxidoreductase subunit E
MILDRLGIDDARFSCEWISAAEGIRFVEVITEFSKSIKALGPLGVKEALDMEGLKYRLRASEMAVENRLLRMAFARQSKEMKNTNQYGKFPSKDKLIQTFEKEMGLYQSLLYLKEKGISSPSELAALMGITEEQAISHAKSLKKKSLWDGEFAEA